MLHFFPSTYSYIAYELQFEDSPYSYILRNPDVPTPIGYGADIKYAHRLNDPMGNFWELRGGIIIKHSIPILSGSDFSFIRYDNDMVNYYLKRLKDG